MYVRKKKLSEFSCKGQKRQQMERNMDGKSFLCLCVCVLRNMPSFCLCYGRQLLYQKCKKNLRIYSYSSSFLFVSFDIYDNFSWQKYYTCIMPCCRYPVQYFYAFPFMILVSKIRNVSSTYISQDISDLLYVPYNCTLRHMPIRTVQYPHKALSQVHSCIQGAPSLLVHL